MRVVPKPTHIRFMGDWDALQLFGWYLLELGFAVRYHKAPGGSTVLLIPRPDLKNFYRIRSAASTRRIEMRLVATPADHYTEPFTTATISLPPGPPLRQVRPHKRRNPGEPKYVKIVDSAEGHVAHWLVQQGYSVIVVSLARATAVYTHLYHCDRRVLLGRGYYIDSAIGIPHE